MRRVFLLALLAASSATLTACYVIPANYGGHRYYGGGYSRGYNSEAVIIRQQQSTPWCWSIGCTAGRDGSVRFSNNENRGDGHRRGQHCNECHAADPMKTITACGQCHDVLRENFI